MKHTQDEWKFGSSPQEGKGHTSHLGQLCLLNMLVIHICSGLKGSTLFSVGAPGYCRICLKLFTGRGTSESTAITGCGTRLCAFACDPFPSPRTR